MTRAVFGQREKKAFAYAHEGILKEYADYKDGDQDVKQARRHQRSFRWWIERQTRIV